MWIRSIDGGMVNLDNVQALMPSEDLYHNEDDMPCVLNAEMVGESYNRILIINGTVKQVRDFIDFTLEKLRHNNLEIKYEYFK